MSCFRRIYDATHGLYSRCPFLCPVFSVRTFTITAQMTRQQRRTFGSAIEPDRGLQRLHKGGNSKAYSQMFSRGWLFAGAAFALSGCVSAGDPAMFANTQGFAPGAPGVSEMPSGDPAAESFAFETADAASAPGIPLPTPSPASADTQANAPATMTASAQPLVQNSTAVDALNRGLMQSAPAQAGSNLYAAAPQAEAQTQVTETVAPQTAPLPETAESASAVATNVAEASEQTETPRVQELAVVAPPKKQSMFARLFAPQAKAKRSAPSGTTKRVAAQPEPKRVAMASAGGALPGVNLRNVLGTGSGTEPTETSTSGNVQLASAAGLARLAPNGLHTQTDRVEIDCFKPQLVRVLKSVERHYGRPVVVTSGYRSPKHNRRIGGASGSRHTSCEAADIQIDGVSKWQLAKYLRSMPGRGGVGTYCHTESVHIDIGNTRDWNWRCRRRK